jgi:hypothetical protein
MRIASGQAISIVREIVDGVEMGDIQVGIIMGSQSDWPTMREAAEILDALASPL